MFGEGWHQHGEWIIHWRMPYFEGGTFFRSGGHVRGLWSYSTLAPFPPLDGEILPVTGEHLSTFPFPSTQRNHSRHGHTISRFWAHIHLDFSLEGVLCGNLMSWGYRLQGNKQNQEYSWPASAAYVTYMSHLDLSINTQVCRQTEKQTNGCMLSSTSL